MIKTKTKTPITKEQELILKENFGKAIEILPGKTEAWLKKILAQQSADVSGTLLLTVNAKDQIFWVGKEPT